MSEIGYNLIFILKYHCIFIKVYIEVKWGSCISMPFLVLYDIHSNLFGFHIHYSFNIYLLRLGRL